MERAESRLQRIRMAAGTGVAFQREGRSCAPALGCRQRARARAAVAGCPASPQPEARRNHRRDNFDSARQPIAQFALAGVRIVLLKGTETKGKSGAGYVPGYHGSCG
eukprot:6210225-Pleurochrysis_carterae.AAC.3